MPPISHITCLLPKSPTTPFPLITPHHPPPPPAPSPDGIQQERLSELHHHAAAAQLVARVTVVPVVFVRVAVQEGVPAAGDALDHHS